MPSELKGRVCHHSAQPERQVLVPWQGHHHLSGALLLFQFPGAEPWGGEGGRWQHTTWLEAGELD